MIKSIRYISSKAHTHYYELIDTDFSVMCTVTAPGGRYVSSIYDHMLIIIREYSLRKLPVAANLALHIFNRVGVDIPESRSLDKLCDSLLGFYPHLDINHYKPCIRRHLDKIKWIQNYKH